MDKEENNNINVKELTIVYDYELGLEDSDLENLELFLNQQEELQWKELFELKDKTSQEKDLFKDLLNAAVTGAKDYIDSFTDVNDSISQLKNPNKIRDLEKEEIHYKDNRLNQDQPLHTRSIKEANNDPLDKNSLRSSDAMSESGKLKFEKYTKAYSQRSKSITKISKERSEIKTSDEAQNFESLSGLKGYRVGPVVGMPTLSQAKEGYNQYVNNKINSGNENNILGESQWLYRENMKQFDQRLMEEFGFKTITEATQWRKDNNLTVHEGPDGMFLVPRDIHDKLSHKGYRSAMSNAMKKNGTQSELDDYARREKVEFVKHEARVRSVKVAKGIGLSIIKDLIKNIIFITGKETYEEFSVEKLESLGDRCKNLLQKIWHKIKIKCRDVILKLKETLKNSIIGALVSELLTILNDFVFKTAKNIMKIIRTMWRSIYNALKVIFSKEYSWQERVFEGIKILSAGFVGVIGFSLNEGIEKILTAHGIPFAGFIAECVSGFAGSIMSAVILMIFDRMKESFFAPSPYLEMSLIESRLIAINSCRISISEIKTQRNLHYTIEQVHSIIDSIKDLKQDINENHSQFETDKAVIKRELYESKVKREELEDLYGQYVNDDDF